MIDKIRDKLQLFNNCNYIVTVECVVMIVKYSVRCLLDLSLETLKSSLPQVQTMDKSIRTLPARVRFPASEPHFW